jgi:subtilase family serine protease
MRSKPITIVASVLVLASLFMIAQRGMGQSSQARLITQPIDESKTIVLRGNVYPLARAEFDRGPVALSLPMERMLLVLKRSPAQETAMETFLAQQLDKSSPNYHNWLTPEQFGERYGTSQDDIAQVTSWLQSHGFQVAGASHGRGVIEFSGNAGQVEQAFHTAIHSYNVDGKQHFANATDPSIPAALVPAVTGVLSLHDFPRKRMSRFAGNFHKMPDSAKSSPISPKYTFNGGCFQNGNCYGVGPTDFATIYNITPLWNAGITGAGVKIAIVNDSNINVSDANAFRSIFGLPSNPPTVTIPSGSTDPGIQTCNAPTNGDECEAAIDVEWSGAVAKGASINLIASKSGATFGGDLSAEDIIDNNLAPIMSESFGSCELGLGTGTPTTPSTNAFYNALWAQGASEGITIIVSTGDNAAAACDFDNPNITTAQPVEFGLAVNGVASTQFNVAVGGTDFNQLTTSPTTFWNSTNTSNTQSSAKGYIPETTWNDSCTNLIFEQVDLPSPEANCNDIANLAANIGPIGGSGGASNCTTSDSEHPSSCGGGYGKPSWQTGPGVPADGKRDLPDVSMFAGDGFSGSFFIVCESDLDTNNVPCSFNTDANTNTGFDFQAFGGTSISTQTFAGVMALVNQKSGRQGNINPTLYALAAKQNAATCNSSAPAATCVFNDVTLGTISAPCVFGVSPNCTRTSSSDPIGILTGFNAGTGYDQATGLGSMNVANLVNAIAGGVAPTGSFTVAPTTPGSTATATAPGQSAMYSVTVTGTGGFAGTVDFTCAGTTGVSCSGTPATLSATITSVQTDLTVTTTPPTVAHLLPQGPGANGLSKYNAPQLAQTPQHLLASTLAMIFAIYAGVFFFMPRNKLRQSTAVFALMVLGLIFVASCGGGSGGGGGGTPTGGTPMGNSTVTVTASSGGVTSTTTFTLTVN